MTTSGITGFIERHGHHAHSHLQETDNQILFLMALLSTVYAFLQCMLQENPIWHNLLTLVLLQSALVYGLWVLTFHTIHVTPNLSPHKHDKYIAYSGRQTQLRTPSGHFQHSGTISCYSETSIYWSLSCRTTNSPLLLLRVWQVEERMCCVFSNKMPIGELTSKISTFWGN